MKIVKNFVLASLAFLAFLFMLGIVRSIIMYGFDDDDYEDDMMFDTGM